jgi:hypothetical protein
MNCEQADNGWEVRYNMADDAWAENPGRAVERDQMGMYVPCAAGKSKPDCGCRRENGHDGWRCWGAAALR